MADLVMTRSDPEGQLWDELEKAPSGMLGIEGLGGHMQPVVLHPDRDAHALWFVARKDSELVKAAADGASAHFCIVGRRHDYHASLCGALQEARVGERPTGRVLPALAPCRAGKEGDPELTFLKLRLNSAAIWASPSDTLPIGWEIAGPGRGDSGARTAVRARIRFHRRPRTRKAS